MEQGPNTVAHWQSKCAELENVIKVLSTHCTRVIQKHQELLVNYKKNQDQYNVLVQKLTDQREQVKKAREVLEPVTHEYQALREKYEIAVLCQQEAVNYATKVEKNNKKLKRQSQMLSAKAGLSLVEINIDDGEDDADETSKEGEVDEYCQKLDKQIEDLSEERSQLSARVKELEENYAIEKEENGRLKEKVDALKTELLQARETIDVQTERLTDLAETSEAAVQEYKELVEDYARQVVDEEQARKKQKELLAENKAVKHQSALLMQNVAGDQLLQRALIDVEDLKKQIETERQELQEKIDVLEQKLKSEKEKDGVLNLESENLTLVEERDSLLRKLADAEKQNASLVAKYAELETKYEMALKAPVPPPPPPPPPPPMAKTTGIRGLIISGKKKRKEQLERKLKTGGAEVNDNYSKALEQMMDRIKSGKALRPVLKSRTKSLPEDEKSAMSELEGVLSKMKRARSEDDLSDLSDIAVFDQPGGIRQSSDLGRVFQNIVAKKDKVDKPNRPIPAPRKPSIIKEEDETKE